MATNEELEKQIENQRKAINVIIVIVGIISVSTIILAVLA